MILVVHLLVVIKTFINILPINTSGSGGKCRKAIRSASRKWEI